MVLKAIRFNPSAGRLSILNQLLLPHATIYDDIHTADEAWDAIKSMRVRGAPAIAIVAALSVAVELHSLLHTTRAEPLSADQVHEHIFKSLDHLLSSRPTAVNLADAVRKLKKVVDDVKHGRHPEGTAAKRLHSISPGQTKDRPGRESPERDQTQKKDKKHDDDEQQQQRPNQSKEQSEESEEKAQEMIEAYIAAATKMLEDDVKDNEAIGRYGAEWILRHRRQKRQMTRKETNSASNENSNGDGKAHGDENALDEKEDLDLDLDFPSTGVSVLTHCNTGSLATAGYGTALGVIRSLHGLSALERAYCTETRPYNQGSRLTAYELVHDNIPATLIADSMAGALFSTQLQPPPPPPRTKENQGSEQDNGHDSGGGGDPPTTDNKAHATTTTKITREGLAAVIVGADRVAANGDTANKVGTYALGVLAKHHGVPFIVAAPRSSIDLHTPSGAHIVIEQRPAHELGRVAGALITSTSARDDAERGIVGPNPKTDPGGARNKGPGEVQDEDEGQQARAPNEDPRRSPDRQGRIDDGHGAGYGRQRLETVSVAAPGIEVWNPAFDVTPAALVDAVVTEVGVVEKGPDGFFDFRELFDRVRP